MTMADEASLYKVDKPHRKKTNEAQIQYVCALKLHCMHALKSVHRLIRVPGQSAAPNIFCSMREINKLELDFLGIEQCLHSLAIRLHLPGGAYLQYTPQKGTCDFVFTSTPQRQTNQIRIFFVDGTMFFLAR
jgi:hypothetical protein